MMIRGSGTAFVCSSPKKNKREDGDVVYNLSVRAEMPYMDGGEGRKEHIFTLLRVRFQNDPWVTEWNNKRKAISLLTPDSEVKWNNALYRVEDVDSEKTKHFFEVYYAHPIDGQEVGYGEVAVKT